MSLTRCPHHTASLVITALAFLTAPPAGTAEPRNRMPATNMDFGIQSIWDFTEDTIFAGTISGLSTLTVNVHDCTLTFSGRWQGGDGTNRSYINLEQGASIVFTKDAMINNNMPDLINARPFEIIGGPEMPIAEFAAEFVADHTGYDTGSPPDQQTEWVADGLSTLRVENAVLVTHASENLPTIHKKAADGSHTHHGLLIMHGTTTAWQVRSASQTYDGGLNWSGPWTLDTAYDLCTTGVYCDAAKVAFGTWGATGTTLTKTGPADLVIRGTQGHANGSALAISAGRVVMYSDPGDPGSLYRDVGWPCPEPGQHLELHIAADDGLGGTPTASLRAATHGFATIENAGRLEAHGDIDCADTARFLATAVYQAEPADGVLPTLTAPTIVLDGTLHIADDRFVRSGTHVLLTAGTPISGSFTTIDLPSWIELITDDQTLTVHVAPRRQIKATMEPLTAPATVGCAPTGQTRTIDATEPSATFSGLDPAIYHTVTFAPVPAGTG